MRETQVWSLGWEDPLEKEMATHSSTLAWKIPWMEEPGRLQSTRGHKELDTTERQQFWDFNVQHWNSKHVFFMLFLIVWTEYSFPRVSNLKTKHKIVARIWHKFEDIQQTRINFF